jgi:hypothetical protein
MACTIADRTAGRIWAVALQQQAVWAMAKAKVALGRYLISIKTVYRSLFNWRTVRAFGAVQLLTKASYAMLVFVPLLAGLWPLANFVIVESKRELMDHANKLDKSAAQLKSVTNELGNRQENASLPIPYKIDMKLVADLDNAAQRANNVAEDLRHAAGMLPDSLPSVWVYAFFAALAVAAGHLVYQTSAPRTIQRYSLEEF